LFEDEYLKPLLLLKGGTAINKLYLKDTSRLSVDIDANHIGEGKDVVARQAKSVREAITRNLSRQDEGYKFVIPRKDWYQTTIHAVYRSSDGQNRKLKVEISHVERFPIVEPVVKSFTIPSERREKCDVPTYSLDELLATKYRALFTRAKARDIYDIYQALKLGINEVLVKKMFIYYMFRAGKVYNPKLDLAAVRKRLLNKQYVDDVTGYVRQGVNFSLDEAAAFILKDSNFLEELDSRDRAFIDLARFLLKKQGMPKSNVDVTAMENPLDKLFPPDRSRRAQAPAPSGRG
jgi:predicted nucleotidyltransferase component of viral defense system